MRGHRSEHVAVERYFDGELLPARERDAGWDEREELPPLDIQALAGIDRRSAEADSDPAAKGESGFWGIPRTAAGFRDQSAELSAAARPLPPTAETAVTGAEPVYFAVSDSSFGSQWHLNGNYAAADIKARLVWEDYTGEGVRIGVVDNGIDYRHRELANNYDTMADYDARARDWDAAPEAGDKHGTTVAGVIAADNNGFGTVGVAFDSTLVGFRIGYGSYGNSSQYADALARQASVDISNNSWSYTKAFQDNFKYSSYGSMGRSIESAVQAGRDGLGTVFVFAAGNNRAAGDNVNYHNLGNSPYVITVAATDQYGRVTSFSNPGDALLISAAGSAVLTTDISGSGGYTSGDYVTMQGTSFAAPIVSGVVALMLEANPLLGYRDVQEILALSARQTDAANADWRINGADNWNGGGMHFNTNYGFGMVDALAAVRLAETWQAQSTYANKDAVSATSTVAETITTTELVRVGKGKSKKWVEETTTTTVTEDINLAIPDNNTAGVSHKLALASGIDIDHIQVDLNIAHQRIGDLVVTLTSPDGTVSTLINRPNSSATSLSFVTESNAFWGEDSGGDWTLTVSDRAGGYVGTLKGWSITALGDHQTANDTYFYTNDFAVMSGAERQLLQDFDGGLDTINAAAVTAASSIDLNAGAASIIAGKALSIGAGTQIENVFAGDGNDLLLGNTAANWIDGGRGQDTIDAGAGNDTLVGGRDADLLIGGAGADLFVYRAVDEAGDSIADFACGVDKLDLTLLVDDLGYAGSDPWSDWVLYLTDTLEGAQVCVDQDGTGGADSIALVSLQGVQAGSISIGNDILWA